MHRCLLISEVLCTILEFTEQYGNSDSKDGCEEDRKLTKRTLASLAQTCRALSTPALDQLWRHLDGLYPLIKLLPKQVRNSKRSSPFIVLLVCSPDPRPYQYLTFVGPIVYAYETLVAFPQICSTRSVSPRTLRWHYSIGSAHNHYYSRTILTTFPSHSS